MSTQPQTLLVLAAGMGSRYGGLKQIDPIGPGGEAIIDYSVHDAIQAGFNKLVFVIRRDIEEAFKEYFGRHLEKHITTHYVFQELDQLPAGFAVPPNRKKPWGTGHALLATAGVIREPFAVINADDFYGRQSFEILASHLRSGSSDHAMVGFVLSNTLSKFGSVSRGICQPGPGGFLESITELTNIEQVGPEVRNIDASGHVQPLTGQEIVSMNMWSFTPAVFEYLRQQMTEFLNQHGQEEKAEFYIPMFVNSLVAARRGRVKVLRTPEAWFGVTYREDRPEVVEAIRQLIARGDYPEKLWP